LLGQQEPLKGSDFVWQDARRIENFGGLFKRLLQRRISQSNAGDEPLVWVRFNLEANEINHLRAQLSKIGGPFYAF
jgi:hypothetical protein